jgi:putative ABC transport system substrate-binding protein
MKKAAVPSILVVVVLLAVAVIAEAQQPKKTYRIGTLSGGSASTSKANYDAFREGLRQLGYVEGANVIFEHRYAHGKR